MRLDLSKRPGKATVITGFPGIGLVGPIVTEFLINHMQTEQIGTFSYDELPATAAIHKGKLVHPMSVHYSKAHNTVIVYTILNLHGHEWELAKHIRQLASDVKAKELICVDGANTADAREDVFVYGNGNLLQHGAKVLEESVITGGAGALLLTGSATCLFASTQSQMPNAKAAAAVVEILDKHLGLDVDYHPLLKQAEEFETKLNSLMEQSKEALSQQERKKMDYLG